MEFENFLTRGEKVLCAYKTPEGETFAATNTRVIRFLKTWTSQDFDDLRYDHIASISFQSRSYWWLSIPGIFLVALGVFIFANLERDSGGFLFSLLFALPGLILTIVALSYQPASYQFIVPGLSELDAKKWRIANASGARATQFVTTVRRMCETGAEASTSSKASSAQAQSVSVLVAAVPAAPAVRIDPPVSQEHQPMSSPARVRAAEPLDLTPPLLRPAEVQRPALPPPRPQPPARVQLIGVEGPLVGNSVTVRPGTTTTLGHDADNTVPIPGDTRVSGHHAELCDRNGAIFVRDLNSTNGTTVDGRRLSPLEWLPLRNGSTIRVGSSSFRLNLTPVH